MIVLQMKVIINIIYIIKLFEQGSILTACLESKIHSPTLADFLNGDP